MTKEWLACTLVAFIFASTTVPATAEVVPITQKKARDGGVTPGDAPGFPVTISRAGSYRMDSNLAVGAGKNGVEITDFDVTIDFNGFRLHGNGAGRNGILGTFNTATIKNGVIAAFTLTGVKGGTFWTIENMQILSERRKWVFIGDSGQVSSSIVANNGSDGVRCGLGCMVEGSAINANAETGVVLNSGTVLGNAIIGNGEWGIARALFAGPGILGYGNNTLFGNNNGAGQVQGLRALQPNACEPAC